MEPGLSSNIHNPYKKIAPALLQAMATP